MPHQLENPQYPHHSDQSDHFASFANNFKIFQTFKQKRQVERYDGKQINQIHWTFHEFEFVWANDQSDQVFQREEDNHKVVYQINDVGKQMKFHNSIIILLQLLKFGSN